MGVRRFCQKMGGSELFLLKNGWEWVVFIEKCVVVCRFCQKMGERWLLLLKNGLE